MFIGPSESSNVPISEIDKQSILGAKQQEVLPDAGAILPCGSKRKVMITPVIDICTSPKEKQISITIRLRHLWFCIQITSHALQ